MVALSAQNGVVGLAWIEKGHISSGGSLLLSKDARAEFEVVRLPIATQPLDEAIPEGLGPKGLIKIDVEGAERLVFRGMPNVLAAKPRIIMETFDPKSCAVINGLIAPLGYHVCRISESQGLLQLAQLGTSHPEDTDGFNFFPDA